MYSVSPAHGTLVLAGDKRGKIHMLGTRSTEIGNLSACSCSLVEFGRQFAGSYVMPA